MSFQQGLSGLNAAAKQLDVIGNNVSNASTVGFKSSRAEFSDLYATSLYGVSDTESGIGSQTIKVAQQFQQGNITATKNPLDMAISGAGFFKLWSDPTATSTFFTRNGQFKLDKDGYFVNNGNFLVGEPVGGGDDAPIKIDRAGLPGTPSTALDWQFNLDADQKSPLIDYTASPAALKAPAPAITPTDATTYNFTTSMRVYDKVGSAHTVSLYFQRQAVAGTPPAVNNTWNVSYKLNNNAVQNVGSVSFTADGKLTAPFSFTVPGGAAAANLPVPGQPNQLGDAGIVVNLAGTTQYSGSFTVAKAKVDGNAKGELVGVETADDGNIIAKYSNGQAQSVGRVRLYTFDNAQGLQPNGENNWAVTAASGDAKPGFPGEGSFGKLQSSAIEESNADTTAELINMIVAQRFYQANAQTIKTQDAILQTLLNLR
ncbi:flagellar hook protein FlgE [Vogesella sp. XCS3]|uniref:flagellar hook protein FlgE n=1 Tax=Vogesella sp. XCS3 TaxID=2877939 RepID=UPI001D0A51D3|nr:flagellar hook protein FlgE [Vogesella sp. XCS3]UDM18181.1 flagellar hook protein FlgE [Vogesella sp. XCS3]